MTTTSQEWNAVENYLSFAIHVDLFDRLEARKAAAS
jgi:hypothetical protein